jgi:hypothetical protein
MDKTMKEITNSGNRIAGLFPSGVFSPEFPIFGKFRLDGQ